jgi:Fic family protein
MDEYPWISFRLDLTKLSYNTWMLLGECLSKCRHIGQVPLLPTVRDHMHQVYLAKGVLATTAIEGNTLTEEQVLKIIEKKYQSPPSLQYQQQEVENIVAACGGILRDIAKHPVRQITLEQIYQFNQQVLEKIPVEDDVAPGQLRRHNIVVGNVYRGPAAGDVHELMQRFCLWLNSGEFEKMPMDPMAGSIIKAIAAHIYIAWIHPFGDGNGRTARLLEFAILLQAGIPSPAAHLLSNHYNATRPMYYRQLDKAGKTGGDLNDFFFYAIQGFRDGLEEQLNYIYRQTVDISWEHYVYQQFRELPAGDMNKRRRNLVLAMSNKDDPLDKDELRLLCAREYKNKTEKTLSRDLHELLNMKLIVQENRKYKSNKTMILHYKAFTAAKNSVEKAV